MDSVTRGNFQESGMGSAVRNVINRGWLTVIRSGADWWSRVIRANRSSARFNERARILIPSMESNYERFPRARAWIEWNGSRDITDLGMKFEWRGKEEKEWRGIEVDMKLLKRPIRACDKSSEVRRIVIERDIVFLVFLFFDYGLLWKSNSFSKTFFNFGKDNVDISNFVFIIKKKWNCRRLLYSWNRILKDWFEKRNYIWNSCIRGD